VRNGEAQGAATVECEIGEIMKNEPSRMRRIESGQIRPNQTQSDQKNGPAWTKAQAVGSKPAQTNLDLIELVGCEEVLNG
jgi:hypothetical protein